jgi:hypothetical protein
MNKNLQAELNTMGYGDHAVAISTEADQDFLIMSKLLRITKTVDFEPEELEYYTWMSENMDAAGHFARGKIQTPDFTPEELREYQWAAEHPTGSCRGFRLTDEPTEEEVKGWQETLEFFNKMDFAAVRAKIEFYDREEEKPYDNDPWFSDRTGEWLACCNLGRDPYSQSDDAW